MTHGKHIDSRLQHRLVCGHVAGPDMYCAESWCRMSKQSVESERARMAARWNARGVTARTAMFQSRGGECSRCGYVVCGCKVVATPSPFADFYSRAMKNTAERANFKDRHALADFRDRHVFVPPHHKEDISPRELNAHVFRWVADARSPYPKEIVGRVLTDEEAAADQAKRLAEKRSALIEKMQRDVKAYTSRMVTGSRNTAENYRQWMAAEGADVPSSDGCGYDLKPAEPFYSGSHNVRESTIVDSIARRLSSRHEVRFDFEYDHNEELFTFFVATKGGGRVWSMKAYLLYLERVDSANRTFEYLSNDYEQHLARKRESAKPERPIELGTGICRAASALCGVHVDFVYAETAELYTFFADGLRGSSRVDRVLASRESIEEKGVEYAAEMIANVFRSRKKE